MRVIQRKKLDKKTKRKLQRRSDSKINKLNVYMRCQKFRGEK